MDGWSKLPPALQTLLGLAVVALGMFCAVFAVLWSEGDIRFQFVFCMLAVLSMLIGLIPMLEGIMTMNAEANKAKEKKQG